MEKFNLDFQFKKYLERVKLSGLRPDTIQYKETKRAFIGACGQMLVLLRDDVTELCEQHAVEMLNTMNKQVLEFFANESNSKP